MNIRKECLIGAHTSASGGVHQALYEGKSIDATTIQLFTSNQKRWEGKPISDEALLLWNKALEETQIQSIMSHDSYLINLGAPNPEILTKSRKAFREEVERCLRLNLTFLNFHPGAALKEPRELCLNRIVESILQVQDLLGNGANLKLLLETTAGQGSCVGCSFEEISYIIQKVCHHIPIGVCIDTCHIFVAGYDIRTAGGLDRVLNEFNQKIGFEYLCAFHINDSMKELGSRVDRHELLGKGALGWECFKALMKHSQTKDIPKYLETPGGPTVWKQEIQLLRSFISD